MYITRGPKILKSLYKYIKRNTKYIKGVTRTEDCLITSYSTMMAIVK